MTNICKALLSAVLLSSVAFAATLTPVQPDLVETSLKGSVPANQALTYKSLEDFNGNEANCHFAADLDSTVCVEGAIVYLDSGLLYSENQEFKIGGSIGRAIGQITNPIRDNVTAPLADQFGINLDVAGAIQDKANSLADTSGASDFNDCVTIVAAGMAAWGASIGGPWGAAVGAGAGVPAARLACGRIYPQ